jgi:KUP system potassium uptake protein
LIKFYFWQKLHRDAKESSGRAYDGIVDRRLGRCCMQCGNARGAAVSEPEIAHQRIVFVTVKTVQIPFVSTADRLRFESLGNGFSRIRIYYGYMEEPNVPRELASVDSPGFAFDPDDTTYFLGRETIIASDKYSGMSKWREHLFSFLSRNATSATSYFSLPPGRVVELGEQVEI